MPAEKHTKKAKSAKEKRQWQHVRDSAEASGDDEGQAIRKASGVIKKESKGKKQ